MIGALVQLLNLVAAIYAGHAALTCVGVSPIFRAVIGALSIVCFAFAIDPSLAGILVGDAQ